ncbi:hypothetical protein JQS43_21230 [Natronosporangium hydrolyticum]|uniref:Uncharacterized protein n=1 Tax=Natronosporangium hydrolyticum TaxID=2811111 RepID=A0A895YCU7_9ACTN|nr:hypothetical protein [Natronosporangium hydrolyticum]QSB14035.1 hypothetical protein JQS43_21230 [Natronosporangium hydrolyticum]
MGEPGQRPESDALQTADALALALEEVGFDVGRAFPLLGAGSGREGVPVVELGQVSASVADSLAAVLHRAARKGLRVPGAAD